MAAAAHRAAGEADQAPTTRSIGRGVGEGNRALFVGQSTLTAESRDGGRPANQRVARLGSRSRPTLPLSTTSRLWPDSAFAVRAVTVGLPKGYSSRRRPTRALLLSSSTEYTADRLPSLVRGSSLLHRQTLRLILRLSRMVTLLTFTVCPTTSAATSTARWKFSDCVYRLFLAMRDD